MCGLVLTCNMHKIENTMWCVISLHDIVGLHKYRFHISMMEIYSCVGAFLLHCVEFLYILLPSMWRWWIWPLNICMLPKLYIIYAVVVWPTVTHMWEFSLPKNGALNYSQFLDSPFLESHSSKSFFFLYWKKVCSCHKQKSRTNYKFLIDSCWIF